MKSVAKNIFIAALVLSLAGCSYLQVKENRDKLYNNIGYNACKLVINNNPLYIPQITILVDQSLALVSGDAVFPDQAAAAILDFIDKLRDERPIAPKLTQDEIVQYIRDILEMLDHVYSFNLEDPDDRWEAAHIIKMFLSGAKRALEEHIEL